MKTTLFAFLSFLLLAGTTRAQMQPDSTPPAQGWTRLTSGTTAGFNYISLVGPDTVYVSGQQILRSTDAGATWDSLPQLPRQSGRLQFVDDTTAFLSADSVFRTTNGGITWKPILGSGWALVVFGSRNNGCAGGGEHTTDGGTTWHPSSGDLFNGINTVIFADSLHVYAMGDATWLATQWWISAPTCDRSSDGGATWQGIYAGPGFDANGHPHSGISRDIYGMAALNADTLFTVGDQIGRSTDGGSDWDTLPDPTSIEHFHGVYFADNIHGTAVGSNGIIVHTTNAGMTWTFQSSGITDGSYLYSVAFADSLTGYTVGDNGIILKTNNGGLSWVNISPVQPTLIEAALSPQPANQQTTLSYDMPEPQHVWLSIFDAAGRKVGDYLNADLQSAGFQSITIHTTHYPSGSYVYDLVTDKYYATGNFQIIH